jgi:hypothetical protein
MVEEGYELEGNARAALCARESGYDILVAVSMTKPLLPML